MRISKPSGEIPAHLDAPKNKAIQFCIEAEREENKRKVVFLSTGSRDALVRGIRALQSAALTTNETSKT